MPRRFSGKAGYFALIGLALSVLLSCGRKPQAAGDEEASGGSNELVAEVTVTRVERGEINPTLAVSGTIAALPNQDVKVSSLVPGRIVRMMVAEGDRVRDGQPLAKIDDRPFRDQIQQAEAAVEQAKANLENARLNKERNENLLERGIAARKDVEDARTQFSVSQAALRQTEAALALARLQLARTEVRSPLAGLVVKRLVSVGEQVDGTAAQPIFEVANTAEVELFGNVPALYLSRIKVGQTLPITTEAFPGKSFRGRIIAISPAVDPSTNVGLVRIRMPNGSGLLRLGQFLSAQLPLESHKNALVVPSPAIYRDAANQARVYRVEGNTAAAVPVKTGVESSGRTELLSGVEAGDTVILEGGYGLGDHVKIKIKP